MARNTSAADVADQLAWTFIGLPYRWGGDDPMLGFDCSGLIVELLQAVGVIPNGSDFNANALWHKFPKTTTPARGCLVFFGKNDTATHVGWVTDLIDGGTVLMIEAGGGGPTTATEADAAKQNAYIKVRPVNRRADILGFVDPFLV